MYPVHLIMVILWLRRLTFIAAEEVDKKFKAIKGTGGIQEEVDYRGSEQRSTTQAAFNIQEEVGNNGSEQRSIKGTSNTQEEVDHSGS